MDRAYYVYVLASSRYGTLYLGVTSNLVQRVWQHKEELAEGFSKEYAVKKLVWFEVHNEVYSALTREKQLKKWRREWKIALIQRDNPMWRDLYQDIVH
jgi:putative endonuclease